MFVDAAGTMAEAYASPTYGMQLNPAGNSMWARYCPLAMSATRRSMSLSNGRALPSGDKNADTGILVMRYVVQVVGRRRQIGWIISYDSHR